MSRLSNIVIGILKFIAFLVFITIVAVLIWLSTTSPRNSCDQIFDSPVFVLFFILMMWIATVYGVYFREPCIFCVSSLVIFLLLVLVFCFCIFALVITNKGAGQVVSGRGYKECRLRDYSNWLQKRVSDTKNCRRISSCLKYNKVCHTLQHSNLTQAQFYEKKLSPIQSGCCKPPTSCGFTYVNATVWQKPAANTTFSDADCNTWDNDKNTLCYNCQSCKAGVLAKLKRYWKMDAIFYFFIIGFLVMYCSMVCSAFRNTEKTMPSTDA
ncbi:tetraspanin-8-like [Tasmannia lanceolata]|uniref:tetraspanin-8-like n=1 Tax=Tasmannia lanceolata TaxID=3420 RepID=UPI004064A29A